MNTPLQDSILQNNKPSITHSHDAGAAFGEHSRIELIFRRQKSSRGGRRTQNGAVAKIAAEALAMLVFQTVVKAGSLASFSKDNGLAVSNCCRCADESGKRIPKKGLFWLAAT